MWSKVDAYVEQYHIFSRGDVIVIGLSGGADSIALAEYLLYKKKSLDLTLAAVHVNHQLRGQEALRDEDYVRSFCETRGIPLTVFREDVKAYARDRHLTEEEAGREIRYACFHKVSRAMEKESAVLTAVAHHMDDQAETLLFRMARGTGPEGMAGMRPRQGSLIRPLLCLRRYEILETLHKLGTFYVMDSSNEQDIYHRNYIRRQILPGLTDMNSKAISHIALLAQQTSQMVDYLSPKMDALYEALCRKRQDGMVFLSYDDFRKLDPFEQSEVLRRMLLAVCGKKKDIEALHVDLLKGLFHKEEGKRLDLPYHMGACRMDNGITIYNKNTLLNDRKAETTKDILIHEDDLLCGIRLRIIVMEDGKACGGYYTFALADREESEKSHCVARFDYDRIKNILHIRTRQEGDYFVMDRTGKRKALRRYFIDRKVPASMRDEISLLADGSHILWVPGMRLSEEYKTGEQTKRILLVRAEPEERERKEENHG